MFSCDYNGWADVPEEEREAIDVFENNQFASTARVYLPLVIRRYQSVPVSSERRAA